MHKIKLRILIMHKDVILKIRWITYDFILYKETMDTLIIISLIFIILRSISS